MSDQQKRLVIMRGIPGAGKSHDAHLIAEGTEGAVVYGTDDYWMVEGEYKIVLSAMRQAHDWNKKRVKDALVAGLPLIIVDNTNTQEWEYIPYVEMAEQFGYAVEFEFPSSSWWVEAAEHMKAGTIRDEDVDVFFTKNSHGVPRDVIVKMMTRFEF